MHNTIFECIESFGDQPRTFSLWDQLTYLRVSKPAWLKDDPNDRLVTLFTHRKSLLANGIVTWGYVVQANANLAKKRSGDCPGEIVYSLDDVNQIDPPDLQRVARELSKLKGTEPTDDGCARIAAHLTNEMTRVYGLKVPRSLSPPHAMPTFNHTVRSKALAVRTALCTLPSDCRECREAVYRNPSSVTLLA